ncbi:MAG: hypothetical protein HQ498_12705 [Pseudohongiella sp.]|nr:hypothetical protein [Pseudohongiella sp.]
MNKDNWRLAVEGIGILAIVVSLILVAVELQQNSNIAQADSYREIVQDIAQWRSELNADPGLLELFQSYTRGGLDDMDAKDQLRIIFAENNFFGSLESAYYSREYGIMSEREWRRFEYSACNHYEYAVRNERVLTLITQEFNDFLKNTCMRSGNN